MFVQFISKNCFMRKYALYVAISIVFTVFICSCQKTIDAPTVPPEESMTVANKMHGHLKQTKEYSSDVAIKWMNMQIRLMSTTAGPNNTFSRPYVYGGIALYEAVVPGMPAYQSIASQLNGLSGLPQTLPGYAYHWPASANAALAYINKKIFTTTSSANQASIDSLENALTLEYKSQEDEATINRSIEFGKTVAEKIIEWAATDGYPNINAPYTPVSGAGYWVPPSIPLPVNSTPYWGNMRRVVAGSGDNAQPGPPPSYSEDPSSAFYKMVKQVYDASPSPGSANAAMALYWRDVPGTTTPGHHVSILKQVLENDKPGLDVAALAYAMGGIMVYDASISTWQTKYKYSLVRPITYIQNVLGHTTWSPLLSTPAHPEYTSAHASLSSANAEALTIVFGDNHPFTDHTFDYLGFPPRSYASFRELGEEAGNSRLYAGIHYQNSIDIGFWQGRKVASNIQSKLRFLK
jgi:hypothetical protein